MKPALLLVDLQNDYLRTPGLQPPAEVIVARAATLVNACRKRCVPVIHIWTTVRRDSDERLPHWRRDNRWLCVDGMPGHQPPDSLAPANGEAIIHKAGFNPFANPALEEHLRRIQCDAVILAGLHLHACVRCAATECLERGRLVYIAEDAVAANDPVHAAATRRWLSERCVLFESTSALLSRLDGDVSPKVVHRSPRRTDQVLFEVRSSDATEVAAAAATAKNAWMHWRRTSHAERWRLLEKIATRLEATEKELALQMAIELGKPLSHGIEEVRRAAANVRDVIRRAADASSPKRDGPGIVRREPLGVIAVISAWNNPVAMPIGKIAPALACGNTVVWKPAPSATRVSESLLRLINEAGAPAETVLLVTGNHAPAQRLAADERVDAVTLTGSALSGYAVQEICARRMIPLQAELSGNNAAIIWDDADFEGAAAEVAWSAFAFAGQRCTANRRVIVPAPRAKEFSQAIVAAAARSCASSSEGSSRAIKSPCLTWEPSSTSNFEILPATCGLTTIWLASTVPTRTRSSPPGVEKK